jgi:hypothetical protein
MKKRVTLMSPASDPVAIRSPAGVERASSAIRQLRYLKVSSMSLVAADATASVLSYVDRGG